MFNKIKNKFNFDKPILLITILLSIIGVILVFSASWPEGVLKHDNGYFFIIRHLRSLAIGLVALLIASNINYKYYKKMIIPIIVGAVFLNLLLFTKFGEDNWGSTRWLDLPLIPSFMPSDVLKIASIMFIAFYLEAIGKNIRTPKGSFFSVTFSILLVGIVFIRDMGSSLVMIGGLGSMLIVAGMKMTTIVFLLGLTIIGSFVGLQIPKFEYRLRRFTSFLDPFANKTGDGMQLINSFYALAMGGVTGVGLGRGIQKFSYIPHVYNDFIFAVMGEEFGLIGTVSLVSLYILFLWRGFVIASKAKDNFGKFLAIGLSTVIVFQAFIHIMVNIGLSPVTGITLPFISYGGTSLMITMYSAGILLNISKNNRKVK